jgi:phosphatidylinositol alpha-1,6-mannosyltransferase
MKKTLLITMDFPPMRGGIATYWGNLSRHLPYDDLVVLAPECDDSLGYDIQQNFLVHRKNLVSKFFWCWPKWLPFLYRTFRVVKRDKIKRIIVAQVLPGGTIAYILKKHYGIPYVLSFHGLDLAKALHQKRKKWLLKKIISNADKIIVNSQYTKKQLQDLNIFQKEIAIVSPCPNNIVQKIDVDEKNKIVSRFSLENKKIILTVARLVERKGHDRVLNALPEIIKQISNVYYLIVGNGENKSYLQRVIKEKKLEDYVKIIDDVTDEELPLFYSLADVFVMPCRELPNGDVEGFGIVFLEANCFLKPVIAGCSGGAPEAVENKVTGLVIDPEKQSELVEAILYLLKNPLQANQYGRAGKERVVNCFNWENQAIKLKNILER